MNFVKPVVLEILHALWISVWNESVILEQRRVHERWRGIFIFLSSSPANKQLTLRATTYQNRWCFGEFATILTYDNVQKGEAICLF